MITSRIKKIDSTSIELKAKYRPKQNSKIRFQKYSIETYIFLPIELGVNKRNFTNIDFYREYKNYLKIDPPKVLLSEIADTNSKFIQTYQKIFKNFNINDKNSVNKLDDNTKILLNIYKNSIKREVKKIKQYTEPKEKIRVGLRLIQNLDISINRYRNRYEEITNITDENSSIYRTFSVGNEYISNLKYRFIYEALLYIMEEEDIIYNDIISKLNNSLEQEINYRTEKDYPLSSTQKKQNEKLIRRWDTIKYFITNKLILHAKIDNESKYLEEILYSFAAGIAMVFATGIAFYYNQKFGNFTLSFFAVLVLSYMFKDRLKEWGRSFFSSILQKQLLDHHYRIYDDNNKNIGISKDGFEFKPITEISKKIYNIRYSEDILNKELMNREEKVLKFTRRININMRHFIKTFSDTDIRGINDIITFNFSPIIMRMIETNFPIYTSTKKGKVKVINSERTYPINIIQAITIDKKTHYHHYNILLSKSGITKLKVIMR